MKGWGGQGQGAPVPYIPAATVVLVLRFALRSDHNSVHMTGGSSRKLILVWSGLPLSVEHVGALLPAVATVDGVSCSNSFTNDCTCLIGEFSMEGSYRRIQTTDLINGHTCLPRTVPPTSRPYRHNFQCRGT